MTKATCSIEGCDGEVRARDWCAMHYKRWRTHGDPLVTAYNKPKPLCSVDGCDGPTVGHGWCSLHWQRWRRHGDPLITTRRPPCGLTNDVCLVEDCGKPAKSLGWCAMHYSRWQDHGSLEKPVQEPKPRKNCLIKNCRNPVEARGWCNKHYLRWQNNGDPLVSLVSEIVIPCSQDGCERRAAKAGICWTHYRHFVAEFGKAQEYRCAICAFHQDDAPRKKLLLDHDHETGALRALLCHHCNVGLGHFKDSPALLEAAIRFLRVKGAVQLALAI